MFVTTRDTGGHRRSKGYASNTAAKSSKTSLSSVLTVGSAGSGDSSSTVTQSSYNRSQHKRRKRPKEHRRRTNDPRKENKNKSVDVFDFLVQKGASEESLPLNGQTTVATVKDVVEDIIEYIPGDLDEPEESQEYEESEGSEGLEDYEDTEGSEELEELYESDNLEGFEDHQEPDEPEACKPSTAIERDNDLDELIESNEPHNVLEPTDPFIDHIEDNENDQDNQYNYTANEANQIDDENDADRSDEEPFTPDIVVHKEDSDPEVYYRSMSDSGISMGSCSMDASIASSPRKMPVLPEESLSRPSSQSRWGSELAVVDPRWTWNTSPGPFYEGFIPPPAPVPPPVMYDMPVYPPYPPYTPYGTPPPMPEDEIRGPAIKIREPSHLEIKPKCFRSFTKMSTRLILQLQDDIAELEGELSVLDAELDCIEAESGSEDEASLRPGTAKHMLKARECEIYQELQSKFDQYVRSLKSMQKIEKMSQPAVASDLTRYHRWLESRISPSKRARHLVSNDLRTLSTTKPAEITKAPTQDTQFMVYSALVNTLLPLVTFKLVSSVLSRLILLIIIVIIGVTVPDRTKNQIKLEDMNCILVCVGISAFAAFFL